MMTAALVLVGILIGNVTAVLGIFYLAFKEDRAVMRKHQDYIEKQR